MSRKHHVWQALDYIGGAAIPSQQHEESIEAAELPCWWTGRAGVPVPPGSSGSAVHVIQKVQPRTFYTFQFKNAVSSMRRNEVFCLRLLALFGEGFGVNIVLSMPSFHRRSVMRLVSIAISAVPIAPTAVVIAKKQWSSRRKSKTFVQAVSVKVVVA